MASSPIVSSASYLVMISEGNGLLRQSIDYFMRRMGLAGVCDFGQEATLSLRLTSTPFSVRMGDTSYSYEDPLRIGAGIPISKDYLSTRSSLRYHQLL